MTPTLASSDSDIQAHLADGSILHFPNGTDPSIVQKVVQQRIQQNQVPPMPAAPIPAGLQPNKPQTANDRAIAQKSGYGSDYDPNETTSQALAKGGKFAQVAADTLAGAGGAAGGTALGGPIVGFGGGVASYTAADQAIEKIKDIIRGKPGNKAISDSVIEGLLNETGGRALNTIGKAAKGLVGPGQQAISDLGGTVSQYLESIGQDSSKNAAVRWLANATKGAAKTIEDVAAPTSKKAAIASSGTIGETALGPAPNSFGGDDPNNIADTVQALASQQRKASFAESNQQATTAKLVGKVNTIQINNQIQDSPEVQQILSHNNTTWDKLSPQDQQAIANYAIQNGAKPPIGDTIEGPILATSTVPAAVKIFQDYKNAYSIDPVMTPVANVARDITHTLETNPGSFSQVWDLKQRLDDISGWGNAEITPGNKAARQLASNLNDDIDNSIINWPNDPQKLGYQSWNLAKQTVEQRNLTFNPEGSGTQNLSHIIENANGSLPAVNATLLDPKQLQRALNAGEQTFPSGKVPAPNARLAYQAANDMRIRDLAKTKDSITGQYRIDPQLVTNAWDAPEFAASRDILYSQQQDADMSQFYKQLAITQQKQQGIGISSKMYMARNGLMLSAPLVAGTLTGHAAIGAGFAGLEVGSLVLAKAMNTPRLARAMIAAAAGQPLSMSDQTFNRMLFGTIQGAVVTSVGTDGSRQKGTVDKDGHFSATE